MPTPAEDLHARFQPDYTPEQLENLGVYDALYRGQAPRLASLGAWKPEWISEHDPKGWAQWYKRYVGGRRIEGEDERQIRRWMSFKARHGGPFAKKPTARRGWALRNWAIDPSKLVPEQAHDINELLDEHQRKAMQKFVQQKVAELNPDVQLQEHQQRVSDRISQDDPRLLLYHGLGTGKSLSAIAAAEAAKKVHGGQYGVVVPASLKQNFQKELGKFTSGSNPEILSYTGLALGKKFQQPPETLVMDEAQRLKNPESASAVAARNLAAQAKRVVLLSGTPITNSPGDLASPLSILRNENITPEDFEKKYVGYEKKFPGIIPYLRGADYGEEPFVKNEPQLRKMLEGKVDYQPGKLPEGVRVNEETVRVPLSPEQRRIQKAVRTKIPPGFLWKLDQEFPLSREELAKLNSFMTGMRQVSLSTQPFRADRNPIRAFDQSSKLREAMKRLRENLDADPRRKAIIYSNFIDAGINPYAAALERDKIPYGVFHGGIAARARQKALADYNAGKIRALLLGPAAAEGISTKGTSLIQLLDPYWHESRTQQARGRGLRFDSHEGLPDDLKDVSVQRYLSASEEPHFLARLIGQRRERTGDEVMQHLADKKEQLNEKFRAILREVGSEKAGARQFAVKLAGWLSDKANAPEPPPAIPQPPPKLTNQHFRPPRPVAATTGTVAGSYKVAPTPGPVQPKIPMRTGVPVANRYSGAYQRWADPTAAGWRRWTERNYSPGPARWNAQNQIAAHVAATPGAQKQYQDVTEQMFTRARAQARQPFVADNGPRPLTDSHVLSGGGLRPMLVVPGTGEQYIGQNRTLPYSLVAAAGRAAGLSPEALAEMTAGKTTHRPSMSRGIVGVHEMEHVNQDFKNINEDTVGPLVPPQAYAEPAAVLNEMVHATDAAHQVTGKPVPGEFALTDNYKPKLEWMRQQALQHGLANMGPAGTGNKTMQELLNTPEGQKWLQMQIDNMPEFPPPRPPVDRAFLKALDSLKSALREKQNQAHIEKTAAAGWGQVAKRLAINAARFGAGGAAGYYANDKYLDRVNPGDPNNKEDPGVSNMGRMRSNLLSAVLGGTLASKGVGRSLYRAQPFSVSMRPHARLGRIPSVKVRPTVGTAGWLGGLGAAAARYGVIMPDMKHSPVGFGLGDVLDPGHSVLPKAVATVKDKSNTNRAVDFMTRPVENLSNWATKNYATPGLLNGVIVGLGGEERKAPTVGDVGMTLAPHFAGGAGGAYLGALAGEGLGDFIFRDNPKENYEERRRQEQRRWWLQFLGGNLGAIGGAAATMGSMPHINKIINQYMTAKKTEKQSSVGSAIARAARAAGQSALGLGRDAALAGGITAGQYAAGIVPPGSYGSDGNAGPQAHDFFGAGTLPLFGANLLATRATGLGGKITGSRTFTGPHRVRTSPIVSGLATGGLLTAMPSVVNTVSAFPGLYKATKEWAADDNQSAFARDTGGALAGGINWADLARAGSRGVLRGITGAEPQSLADAAAANKAKAGTDETDLANNAAAVGKDQAKKFLASTGAGTVAMGTGMTAGGIAGMTAGEWLVDKLLTAGVNKKWLKKRKHLHRFLRDIGSLTGMGLGAYGGLTAVDYATPAVMQYFNSKQPAASPAKKA